MPAELLIECQREAVCALQCNARDRCICKTQPRTPLLGKRLKYFREEIGTRHKIELIGIEKQAADTRRNRDVTAHQQHCGHFQKDVFEQQAPASLSFQETLHPAPRQAVMCVTLVVETDDEARIENDHRCTP
jgi:hypothetical protein